MPPKKKLPVLRPLQGLLACLATPFGPAEIKTLFQFGLFMG
jgi:hypothetical protein